MNGRVTPESLDYGDGPDIFVDAPRLFVLGRPSLSNSIDEFNAYFHSKLCDTAASVFPAEMIVENAGRVCYLSFSNPSGRSTQAYVGNLVRQGHESVLEHVAWTFVLAGVSRAFTHQMVRHRVGFAYSQLSQQYVDHRSIRFVIPPEMLSNRTLLPEWKKAVLSQRDHYVRLLDALENASCWDSYEGERVGRRKGEMTPAQLDREYPHQVLLRADDYRGSNYQTVHGFCIGLSLAPRGHSIYKADAWHHVFCFSDPADAEKFRALPRGEGAANGGIC